MNLRGKKGLVGTYEGKRSLIPRAVYHRVDVIEPRTVFEYDASVLGHIFADNRLPCYACRGFVAVPARLGAPRLVHGVPGGGDKFCGDVVARCRVADHEDPLAGEGERRAVVLGVHYAAREFCDIGV